MGIGVVTFLAEAAVFRFVNIWWTELTAITVPRVATLALALGAILLCLGDSCSGESPTVAIESTGAVTVARGIVGESRTTRITTRLEVLGWTETAVLVRPLSLAITVASSQIIAGDIVGVGRAVVGDVAFLVAVGIFFTIGEAVGTGGVIEGEVALGAVVIEPLTIAAAGASSVGIAFDSVSIVTTILSVGASLVAERIATIVVGGASDTVRVRIELDGALRTVVGVPISRTGA